MSGKKQINGSVWRQTGFTLIEVLVVTSLTVMIMLTASALFMTFLISGAKTANLQLIKQEGDHAMNQMAFLLRNAIALHPNAAVPPQTCASNMTQIVLESLDGGITTLGSANDTTDNDATKLASSSATQSQFLTSSAVQIVEGPTFDCTDVADGTGSYVTISFKLRKGTPNLDQARDIVEETFTTGVSLRNL
jgi:prepilin-type N-terminal cleavage/methylation domain-containing protein